MAYQCKNPVFMNDLGTIIDVELNHTRFGWIPFAASPDDSQSIGREIYAAAIAGAYGEISPYIAPPPPPPKYKSVLSVLEFRERFTKDEQRAIKAATYTDPDVGIVYDDFMAAQFIDLSDERVVEGVELYISKGLLKAGRKASILEPENVQ